MSEARKVRSVFNELLCRWWYWHPYYSGTVLVETTSLMKGVGLNFVFLSGNTDHERAPNWYRVSFEWHRANETRVLFTNGIL